MTWIVRHKSGRELFRTDDEFIADNRRKMGWVVEEVVNRECTTSIESRVIKIKGE